jgi:hypothetical protein
MNWNYFDKKIELARSLDTPARVLIKLSKDSESLVRTYVADNPNTPLEALRILATDSLPSIRYWVGRNPNATEEIIMLVNATNFISGLKNGIK